MNGNDKLNRLYQYQEARRLLFSLEEKLAGLVSSSLRETLAQRLARLKDNMASCQGAISYLRKEIKRLESLSAVLDYHRRQTEEALYGGKITSPKELAQLQMKIAEYEESRKKAEEETLTLMYALEEKEDKLRSWEKAERKIERELETIEKKLEREKKELEQEIRSLKKKVEEVETLIPPDLKERYFRMAGGLQGIVIAPVKEGACGACHVLLSPGVLERLKKDDGPPLTCENCGRMIFINLPNHGRPATSDE